MRVVYKKKRHSRDPRTHDAYTDMRYSVKIDSLRYQRGPQSEPTLESHQHDMKPPEAAVNPVQDIELRENEELAEDTYESI